MGSTETHPWSLVNNTLSYTAMLNFMGSFLITNPHLHLAPPFLLHCGCLNFGPLLLFPQIIIISSEFVPLLLASYPSNHFFTYSMEKKIGWYS